MKWYIGIGDDLQRDKKIRFTWQRMIPENYSPSDLIFNDRLVECEDQYDTLPLPPHRSDRRTQVQANKFRRFAPRYKSSGRNIKTNCELKCDMRGLTRGDMTRGIGLDGTTL